MKKFFQILGLITLTCFSFFYTEKVGYVVKEMDLLMEEVKTKSENYKKDPIDATIVDNTIIPGLYGKKVNINESYNKMKRINEYNENMLEYDEIKPNVSIKKNYDKYVIGGNKTINEVSIIFLVKGNVNIDYIQKIALDKDIEFNFFVDSSWFEKNNDLINKLIKEGHNIGNLGLNGDYSGSDYIWMDTILKKIVKQRNNYCYLEDNKEEYLKICASNKNYTVKPSIIIKNNPTANVKKNIENGAIISIEVNNNNIDELGVMINYIQSKGYKIVSLNNLLNEDKY